MTLPEIIMWAIVFAVGVPSAWRNPTAGALVLSKLAGWAIYKVTGNNLPVEFYLYPDIFVLSIIAIKRNRSDADWVVAGIFPVAWCAYVADMAPYDKWWLLYYLVAVQFLAVGWDSLSRLLRAHNAVSDTPANGDVFRRLAWARGYD